MDIEQFRKAGYQAIDRICEYYYSLQEKPVASPVEPGYLRQYIPLEAPEEGEDFQVIADDYQKIILPGMTHWQHPSFFAYFPTACSFEGILGDLYATSACNPGFNWSSSPACTELEVIVMDWAARLLGLSPAFLNASGVGGGCLQTTASDSALISIVAARSRFQRNHPEVKSEQLVIYTTTQTHSLGLKAGLVLSLQVRALPVREEDHFSLRGETLRMALEEDISQSLYPFVLIATVGTTSSGAVDNLSEIRDVVKDFPELWVHVDAAWAGVALACPEYRKPLYLDEINEVATSFCTNFHKWGLVNFDASTLWVKDRKYLTEALDVTPPFLRTKHGDAGLVIDYRNWHLGLGRRFRSLKLWFVLRGFGAEGFRKYIRKSIELNNIFVKLMEASDNLCIVTPPFLGLTVFRIVPKDAHFQDSTAVEILNQLNRIYYGRLSARNDILLTQTTLNGTFCIRLAVGAQRTEETHIRHVYDILNKEADAALEAWGETVDTKGPA